MGSVTPRDRQSRSIARGAAALLVAVAALGVAVLPALTRGAAQARAAEFDNALAGGVAAPPIVWKPIRFGPKRQSEMAAYSRRHYGVATYKLRARAIVLHFTAGGGWQSAWNYFSHDVPDPEFHELPGPVAHFIIDKDGTIYQLLNTHNRGRHTYGLNHVAIGIEFVQEGTYGAHWADLQILRRPAQITAGLKLVRLLRAKYHIALKNVIGHSMALGSPFYKDLLGLRSAHGDWQRRDVLQFRARL